MTRPEDNHSSNEVCCQHAEIKIAGRLKQFSSAWENITSDEYIFNVVKGYTKLNLLIMLYRAKHIYRRKSVLMHRNVALLIKRL